MANNSSILIKHEVLMSSYWDGPEFKGRMGVVRHVVRSASHNPVIRFKSYQGDENQ